MIFLIRERAKIIGKEEIEIFLKKYGEIFEEFNESGISAWLFYVLYIVRRIALVICINCFNQPIIQLLVYIFFCILVFNYLDIDICEINKKLQGKYL